MSEQKGFGSKILGLFVDTDDARPEGRPDRRDEEEPGDEGSAELAGQTAPEAKRSSAKAATPLPEGAPPPAVRMEKGHAPTAVGPMDFDAVFRSAGMDADDLDRVKKAEELLRSLPEATPTSVQRQIVEASLRAFGFEIEKIIQAAQNQKRALDAHMRVNESAITKAFQESEAQIRALNEKIAALRAEIEKHTAGLTALTTAVQARKAEVQKVIDFFQGPTPGSAS